ncbi:hypothetical protein SAMN05216388_102080 [Halorientalis persicus]|uniref:CopG family transcriptional regulator n=1 Tax=Halorientalis persicus TaxID=1367881 RepID=A0A1H8SXV5_9EURY|nr:hypothetical protein [Halorientalis persicus]SEO83590.1 hypothetical protein SAMN05216388_102080 [Halorientalis persicus]
MGDISLSDALIERIEDRAAHTEFETADEYAEFVLESVLERLDDDGGRESEEASPRDDVQDRLQSLGYLDE